MPRPVILAAALALAVTPALGQVKVDLHALDALPNHSAKPPTATARPAAKQAVHAAPHVVPPIAQDEAAHAGPPVPVPSPGAPPGTAQAATNVPALPDAVPSTAPMAPLVTASKPPAALPLPAAAPPAAPLAAPSAPSLADHVAPNASLRIAFASGQADLSPDSTQTIRQFAGTAPKSDAAAFSVAAYAAGNPDDASTARRLSLSRALAVRDALIQDGVPSARIYVRALGSKAGDGPADRVDISTAGATTQPAAIAK
jgi:outer membrane protein OmpA-like peptidoglycan-associated protein